MDGKKIVKIASGQQHSLALDDTGFVVCHPLSQFLMSYGLVLCMCGDTTGIVVLDLETKLTC